MTKEQIIDQLNKSYNEKTGINEGIDDAAHFIAAAFAKHRMTKAQLDAIPVGEVFHVCSCRSRALNVPNEMHGDPQHVFFVFKKGGRGDDWAVYAQTFEYLYKRWDSEFGTMLKGTITMGNKVRDFDFIREIFPIDEECFKTYRL